MYTVKPGRACGKDEGGVRNAYGQNSCACQPSLMETSLESRMLGNQPVRFGKGGATRSCLTSCGSRRQRHLTWGSAPSTLPRHAVGVIRRCEALGTMNASLARAVVNP